MKINRAAINMLIFSTLFIFLIGMKSYANERDEMKSYFNKMNVEVQKTNNPTEKRSIMNKTFIQLHNAIAKVNKIPLSQNDKKGLALFDRKINERYNELNGLKGYQKVSDNNLNNFSAYSVQSFEQADYYITISVVALILIVLVLVLLL